MQVPISAAAPSSPSSTIFLCCALAEKSLPRISGTVSVFFWTDQALQIRAHLSSRPYPPGFSFPRGASSESERACLAHFPRSCGERYISMCGRVLRIPPRLRNEGSGTRSRGTFGLEFPLPGNAPGAQHSCCVRAISRGSHFRQHQMTPIWVARSSLFLVSIGQAVRGILKRATGGLGSY